MNVKIVNPKQEEMPVVMQTSDLDFALSQMPALVAASGDLDLVVEQEAEP